MRKFYVKQLCGMYHPFGIKRITALRCTRIGMPLFLGIILFAILREAHPWASYALITNATLFAIYCWMTFPWWGLSYFELWPLTPDEIQTVLKRSQ
jgi:hypothetical protein